MINIALSERKQGIKNCAEGDQRQNKDINRLIFSNFQQIFCALHYLVIVRLRQKRCFQPRGSILHIDRQNWHQSFSV